MYCSFILHIFLNVMQKELFVEFWRKYIFVMNYERQRETHIANKTDNYNIYTMSIAFYGLNKYKHSTF